MNPEVSEKHGLFRFVLLGVRIYNLAYSDFLKLFLLLEQLYLQERLIIIYVLYGNWESLTERCDSNLGEPHAPPRCSRNPLCNAWTDGPNLRCILTDRRRCRRGGDCEEAEEEEERRRVIICNRARELIITWSGVEEDGNIRRVSQT